MSSTTDPHRRRPTCIAGLLDRNRIVADPDSTAGSCRRRRWRSICASAWPMASASSGCRCRAPSARQQAARLPGRVEHLERPVHHELRLAGRRFELGVHPVHRRPRRRRGAVGRLAGARRAAQGRRHRRLLLVRRPAARCRRHRHPPTLDPLARHRRAGRHRPRAGLHLPGVDIDKMVPGPPRHGHRHGDHGLRRRGDDRRPAGADADDAISAPPARPASGRPSSCWPRSTSSS